MDGGQLLIAFPIHTVSVEARRLVFRGMGDEPHGAEALGGRLPGAFADIGTS